MLFRVMSVFFTYVLRAVREQVAGEGVREDAELMLAHVLDAAKLLGVRARGHAGRVPISDYKGVILNYFKRNISEFIYYYN